MEEMNKWNPEAEVELDQINIIMKIPKEAVRLEVTASIMDDGGGIHEVHTILSPSKIRDARQDFLNNVEFGDDYDAVWTLTDKGREMYEHMNTDEDSLRDSTGINDLEGE